ncbi:MAG: TIR domain-containing protein [Okeania sp. SIO3C4]|nr:TIR domain-containing protein [Okeania sp. SIO3B3]NER05895.1 TIR domain-containing protein [Okeania sp. SIO3C4]
MVEEKEFHVFLYYEDKDRGKVENIAKQLKKRGIKCWDKWELPPGSSWQRKLEQQIENINAAAVFIGNNGSGLLNNNEIRPYLQKFQNRGCPVIPVLLANAPKKIPKLPTFLVDKTWVDFRGSQSRPIDRLFWGITGKVSEQELQVQEFFKRFRKHLQTTQNGDLYFQDIQKILEESKLLETLIKENSARQEKERQKKPNFLPLIFLLFLVGGIGGFGGFKLHEAIAKEQINQLAKELSSLKKLASQKDNSVTQINNEALPLKDKIETTEIMLKEKDDQIKNLQEQLNELKKNPIIKDPEGTINSNNTKENSTESPSTGPRANLTTDKTTYTRLEPITVNFYFQDIPQSEGYQIKLYYVSNQRSDRKGYKYVNENGKTEFKPQRPGDYEIRAYVNSGSEWVEVEKLPIKIASEL